MNSLKYIRVTAVAMGIGIAASAFAVETQDQFPTERTQLASCADVRWNTQMRQDHPALIDACQEVVTVDGENWARFEASFVRVQTDGNVVFSVRDRRDRSVEEVTLMTTPGQVAYMDGRETPFNRLNSSDRVNLYMPEGEYGFATQPGVPRTQVAAVAPRRATQPVIVAQRDPLPATLPTTAGPLPWVALGGLLSLLGGLGLTTLRRNA